MSTSVLETTTHVLTKHEQYLNESHHAFSWVDYLIFGLFLCISLSVGIYQAWKAWYDRKFKHVNSSSSKLMYQGDGEMPMIPIALSLLTSFLSGVTLLGTPAEIYARGVHFWLYYMSGALAFVLSGFLFLPIMYKLKALSIYEYFEKRFESRLLRRITSALFEVTTCFYMAVVLYGPSAALARVTQVLDGDTWPWILVIGCVCTFYTTIGGLKAVVWTDTIQAFFMYFGLGCLIVKGIIDSDGLARVWQIAEDHGTFDSIQNFDPNPFQYASFWTAVLGGFSFWMSQYGLNQMSLQRYIALPSIQKAKIVVCITAPAFCVLASMAAFIGVIMIAYFSDTCDPLYRSGDDHVGKDELVILYAVKLLKVLPGLPGLFLACVFSATLSTFSSGMNSQAAVLWEDFLKYRFGKLDETRMSRMNKAMVVCFGVVSTCLAFACKAMGGIVSANFVVMGSLCGPLTGVFFLGVFVPFAHKSAAIIAMALSMIITIFFALGGVITKPYNKYIIPGNTTLCDPDTYVPTKEELTLLEYGDPDTFILFRLSSYLIPFISLAMVLIFGTIISYAWKDPELYNADGSETDVLRRRRYWTLWARRDDQPKEYYDENIADVSIDFTAKRRLNDMKMQKIFPEK